MMQIYHSRMVGVGNIGNTTDLFVKLREIVEFGVGKTKPDAINGQFLTFNHGYFIDELALYEVSDGVSSVFGRAQQIDDNTIELDNSIDHLNIVNVSFKAAAAIGWTVEDDGSITNGEITLSDFSNQSFIISHINGARATQTLKIGHSGDAYFFIDAHNLVLRPSGGSATWPGQLLFYLRGKNGYYFSDDRAGQLTNIKLLGNIVSTVPVKYLNSSIFLGQGSSASNSIGFIQPWANNEFLPKLMQSTGSVAFTDRNKMYFHNEKNVFVSNLYHGPSSTDSYFFGIDLS